MAIWVLLGRFQIYNWDPKPPAALQKLSDISRTLKPSDTKELISQAITSIERPFTGSCTVFHESLTSMGDLSIKKVLKLHHSSRVSTSGRTAISFYNLNFWF